MMLNFVQNTAICIGDLITIGNGDTRMIIRDSSDGICLLDLESGQVTTASYENISVMIDNLSFKVTDVHRNPELVLSVK